MQQKGNLNELFQSFEQLKVLIIGDVMVDSYITGKVERISPEAPVPVVHVKSRENRLGGAANVALNIQSMGATPILCSIIGDDINAETFRSLLSKRGMTDRGIINSAKRTTTVKHRVISGGHHLIRIDEEVDQPLDDIDRKTLIDHISQLIQEADVVIFEDYDKGTLDKEVIAAATLAAKAKGIKVAVDPKKRNFLAYEQVSLFKPNLKELKEGLNRAINPESIEELSEAVQQLQDHMDFDAALITLSEHGIFYKDRNSQVKLPAHVRSISDVSGAGDTVISIAALGLALNLTSACLTELSNLGGGIVCEYPGVVPIDKDRLLKEARSNELIKTYFD